MAETLFRNHLGEICTRQHLEELKGTRRWVISRKSLVVQAVKAGVLGFEEACEWYNLQPSELKLWQTSVERQGLKALRVTKAQELGTYRGMRGSDAAKPLVDEPET